MKIILIIIAIAFILALLLLFSAIKNAHTISEDFDHDEMYHGFNENKKPKQDE